MRQVRILAVFMGLLFTVSPVLAAVCGISCDVQEQAAGACHKREMADNSRGAPPEQHAQCGEQISQNLDPSLAAHAAVVASMYVGTPCGHAALVEREAALHPAPTFATAALTASSFFELLPRNESLAIQVSWRQPFAPGYSPLLRTLRI